MKQRIFISNVQKEFGKERQALKSYLLGDALLSRFFDVFLFEDIPAIDRRADSVYLEEVQRCDVYLALLGDQYGWEDADGISPTHRDYTSNGSVQVMLFADRLEVWNPGTLPPSLTLEKLRHPHGSVPGNPLLAEPLYLTKYIERMGTGTGDMIKRCRNAGLLEPEFTLTDGFVITLRRKPDKAFEAVGGIVTGEVTGEVKKLLMVCRDVMTRKELQENLYLKGEENFRKLYLVPALEAGYIEMTLPDKPQSRLQKYRLTPEGKVLLARLSKKGGQG